MIRLSRAARVAACLMLIFTTGCTAVREIPRSEYGAKPERHDLTVRTKDGLVYTFDYAKVANDSMTGFRRRDVEGSFDDYATLRLAFDDIEAVSTRGVDWRRTGIVGAAAVGVVVAGAIKATQKSDNSQPSSSGGKNPDPN